MPSAVLGIDLGTTNCVVAVVMQGRTILLANNQGQHLFPSAVTLGEGDTIWTGEEAVALGAAAPGRTAYAVKRLIGRYYNDSIVQKARNMYPYHILENSSGGGVTIQLGEKQYTPEEISSLLLKDLVSQAGERFGFEPKEAVITVPAYFNHAQREATQRAAQLANLNVLRLLNEPTAAALSLPTGDDNERVIAVYDFGGGTFDISLIRIQGSVYEVLATNGDTFLGGDDVDGLICDELSKIFEQSTGIKLRNFPLSWHRLRDAAEKAKMELSHSDRCAVYLPRLVGEESFATELSLKRLEDMTRPLIERSLKICSRTIEEAKLCLGDLDEVILVGGQTRMPLLRKMVEGFFERPAAAGVNPDTAVAEGAASEGAMLRDGKGALLLDVTPITLGINIVGNRLYPLIKRNTKIPVRKEHTFTTHRDAQTRAKMVILQGDNPVASENVRLGEVVLANLQGSERFQSRINVAFEIDSSGILHIKAIDEDTREEKEVVIRDSFEKEGKQAAGEVEEAESVAPTQDLLTPTISGPFRETELVDVLCFLHANQKTGRVEIKGTNQVGSLFMSDGEITNAEFSGLQGIEAFHNVLALSQGDYAFHEGLDASETAKIDTPFDILIGQS
ncbi:MAG: Hsp70 family protein [Deltaproteobacteria bacterium]|nr:Hsp70 family protein [Deltaproteobacteria bacterium]